MRTPLRTALHDGAPHTAAGKAVCCSTCGRVMNHADVASANAAGCSTTMITEAVIPHGIDPGRYYTTAAAADITGHSVKAYEAWRLKGFGGPMFHRVGPRSIRYLGADLIAWIEAGRRTSTSGP